MGALIDFASIQDYLLLNLGTVLGIVVGVAMSVEVARGTWRLFKRFTS